MRRVVLVAALLAAFPAAAQDDREQDWQNCLGAQGVGTEQQIKSCTSLIESGFETPRALAVLYSNRGVALRMQGQRDRSLEDFDAAIRLDPDNANAYYNRAIAWRQRGQPDRAIADYDSAI